MKVYNKEKTLVLEQYDLDKGYLKEDTIINHIPEVLAVEEEYYYETIAEYENGGKDVRKVISTPARAYSPARDEEEEILVYIPYTEKELLLITKKARIGELKTLLSETDYKAIKYAEGAITEYDYLETKKLRQSYRDEINRLESDIKLLEV